MAKATFLGHSAVQLSDGKTTILIDPFLSGNPQATVSPDELSPDFIVLTHGHGDHVGDTVAIAKRSGATCIAIYELALWLQGQGLKAHPMGVGGSFDFPFGWVKFTIAHHSAGAGELGDTYVGDATGVLIKLG
ncbi:MAG: metal-dependent hydrolase, partial [Candidatus Zixiibacteriota bacterium]